MDSNDYILIDRYLQGELSNEEVRSFKQRLKDDEEFAGEYSLRKGMDIFLEKERNQPNLESSLERLGDEFFEEEKKKTTFSIYRNRIFIGLAAAAAIALALIIWNPFEATSLYDQYAIHQPISLTEKSTTAAIGTKAEKEFNTKNYKEAYKSLSTYIEQKPDDQKAKLALGISALELDKLEEASSTFSAIQNSNSALKEYGTWYLALTYLKKGDNEKAKSLLTKITSTEKNLFEKATKLLKSL